MISYFIAIDALLPIYRIKRNGIWELKIYVVIGGIIGDYLAIIGDIGDIIGEYLIAGFLYLLLMIQMKIISCPNEALGTVDHLRFFCRMCFIPHCRLIEKTDPRRKEKK